MLGNPRVWVDLCDAAENIKYDFGLLRAMDYLIGQKFFMFLKVAKKDRRFAAELPNFADEIQEFLSLTEIHDYLERFELHRVAELIEEDDYPFDGIRVLYDEAPIDVIEDIDLLDEAKALLL